METEGQQVAGAQVTWGRVGGTGGPLGSVLPTANGCTGQGSGAVAGQAPLGSQGLRAVAPGSQEHSEWKQAASGRVGRLPG